MKTRNKTKERIHDEKIIRSCKCCIFSFRRREKVAMELNETPEQPLPKEKNHQNKYNLYKLFYTRKNPSLVFSNEGFLFYSVILSPASNTFPVQFCSFSTN